MLKINCKYIYKALFIRSLSVYYITSTLCVQKACSSEVIFLHKFKVLKRIPTCIPISQPKFSLNSIVHIHKFHLSFDCCIAQVFIRISIIVFLPMNPSSSACIKSHFPSKNFGNPSFHFTVNTPSRPSKVHICRIFLASTCLQG